MSDVLDLFIEKFVLCGSCRNPETFMVPSKGQVKLRCISCGNETVCDPKHKMSDYVLKGAAQAQGQARGDGGDGVQGIEEEELQEEQQEQKGGGGGGGRRGARVERGRVVGGRQGASAGGAGHHRRGGRVGRQERSEAPLARGRL